VQDYFVTTQGSFTFDGSFSGNDFADFLLGYSQKYNEFAIKSSGTWRNMSPDAYIQDNWRATSHASPQSRIALGRNSSYL
jgi:hypothetical protein